MQQVRIFCFIPRRSERLPSGISEQIRRFAMGIVNGMEIDDLEGGAAVTDGDHPAFDRYVAATRAREHLLIALRRGIRRAREYCGFSFVQRYHPG